LRKPLPQREARETAEVAPSGAEEENDLSQEAAGVEVPDLSDETVGGAPDAVAELEAVVGMSDDEELPEKREAEEPSNFLAMYFRDMARLAVLRPQEEFESARKIEGLEVAV